MAADMVLEAHNLAQRHHAIAEKDDKYAEHEPAEGFVPQVEVAGVLEEREAARTGPPVPELHLVIAEADRHRCCSRVPRELL